MSDPRSEYGPSPPRASVKGDPDECAPDLSSFPNCCFSQAMADETALGPAIVGSGS